MSDEELEAIRGRAEKATPGPWMHDGPRAFVANQDRIVAKIAHFSKHGSYVATVQDDENADFIAHAREDIPALLAEINRLRSLL